MREDCSKRWGAAVFTSGRITEGPEGAWPPERLGGPLETSGLKWYKGPRGPLEINHPSSIQITQHNTFVFRVL